MAYKAALIKVEGNAREKSHMTKTVEERWQEALLNEYSEVCSNFRTLTDIRFKLLAFLPIASAAAVATLNAAAVALYRGGNEKIVVSTVLTLGLALSLFGLVATIGLATYNARNDQLYDDLVARAAEIERSLNIPDGAFANRPGPWLRLPLWKIDHRTAVSWIYAASIALWLFGVAASGIGAIKGELSQEVNSVAIVVAIVVTFLVSLWIKSRKKRRLDRMKYLARKAVKMGVELQLAEAEKKKEFIRACAELSGSARKTEVVQARARYYANLNRKRFIHYFPERLVHHLPQKDRENSTQKRHLKELATCHLISLLTDLPPHWIYDSSQNRKGDMGVAKTYSLTFGRRLVNWLMKALLRTGWGPKSIYLLTVKGRKTGDLHTTPVTLVEEDGQRCLVAPYGEVNWVHNARAAGEVTLTRGRRSETVPIIELGSEASAPILKNYVNRVPITRSYFVAAPDEPVEAFVDEAPRHPVFRLDRYTYISR